MPVECPVCGSEHFSEVHRVNVAATDLYVSPRVIDGKSGLPEPRQFKCARCGAVIFANADGTVSVNDELAGEEL